jgi:hypothetical protein
MPTHDNHLQRAITLAAANVENGGRPFGGRKPRIRAIPDCPDVEKRRGWR